MATTAKLYGNAVMKAFNKEIDFDTDVIKVMLCTSAYVPNQDTHIYKSSVTNEVSSAGTGYTAGGYTLTGISVTYDSATNKVKFTASDTTIAGIDIPDFRYAVIYNSSPASDATRPLLSYVDFGAAIPFTGDLLLRWNTTDGIFSFTAA